MEDFKLIYFKGCPNYEKMSNLLWDLKIAFEEILQNDLPLNHSYQLLSSPAILKKNASFSASVSRVQVEDVPLI